MRALALFSGGLDSMLAIGLITRQNIDVTAINVNIGFGGVKDMSEVFKSRANAVGADFEVLDVRQKYIDEVLFAPKFGYGKRFNPCIDCHAFMMREVKSLLRARNASFIITGEVLGQRPMSQNGQALKNVLALSEDADDIILRPLSAKLLSITKPEIEGWVDRERLLDIEGRGRERQLGLAREWNLGEFASPGGGCLLTDVYFADKMRDFTAHDKLEVADIELLKIGRHFRLGDGAKLVLGRNESENNVLQGLMLDDFVDIFCGDKLPAPYGKISKSASLQERVFAARAALFYTKIERGKLWEVRVGGEMIEVCALENAEELKKLAVGV